MSIHKSTTNLKLRTAIDKSQPIGYTQFIILFYFKGALLLISYWC